MKYNIHNARYNLFFISTLIVTCAQAQALSSDNQQPIHINSAQQSVDMKNNTITLVGNVIVKRGSIDIRADKVVIIRPSNKRSNEVVESFGNPVTFYQLQDNGTPIFGHADNVRYDTANELLVLSGGAYLEHINSNVSGDRITYLVKKQKMEAFSDKGKQVITILMSAPIKDKTITKSSYK